MTFTHRQVLFMSCIDEIKVDKKCKGTVLPEMKIQALSSHPNADGKSSEGLVCTKFQIL